MDEIVKDEFYFEVISFIMTFKPKSLLNVGGVDARAFVDGMVLSGMKGSMILYCLVEDPDAAHDLETDLFQYATPQGAKVVVLIGSLLDSPVPQLFVDLVSSDGVGEIEEVDLCSNARIILLLGVKEGKNKVCYERLKGDEAFRLLKEGHNLRNGYAFFERLY